MSKIEDVARGLLVDAFITYAAICREKGYFGVKGLGVTDGIVAITEWSNALRDVDRKINAAAGQVSDIACALIDETGDEHVEALIEERRGLIRDTMQEEMADLEAASPSAEDFEGIRDGEQG